MDARYLAAFPVFAFFSAVGLKKINYRSSESHSSCRSFLESPDEPFQTVYFFCLTEKMQPDAAAQKHRRHTSVNARQTQITKPFQGRPLNISCFLYPLIIFSLASDVVLGVPVFLFFSFYGAFSCDHYCSAPLPVGFSLTDGAQHPFGARERQHSIFPASLRL